MGPHLTAMVVQAENHFPQFGGRIGCMDLIRTSSPGTEAGEFSDGQEKSTSLPVFGSMPGGGIIWLSGITTKLGELWGGGIMGGGGIVTSCFLLISVCCAYKYQPERIGQILYHLCLAVFSGGRVQHTTQIHIHCMSVDHKHRCTQNVTNNSPSITDNQPHLANQPNHLVVVGGAGACNK